MFAARKTDNVSSAANYIEDVFSTYLYTGTGATRTITNNIDLSTYGGLVWNKLRNNGTAYHYWVDTARGRSSGIGSNSTDAQYISSAGNDLASFTTTGYTLGPVQNWNASNANGEAVVSWTFRKQAKFFDVVTYTGNGSNRTIAHNLGSVPGCIIVKSTSTAYAWRVYHRSLGNTKFLTLNTTDAENTGSTLWNNTTPTATEFTVGTASSVNANGDTFVAYLFAHDAGGFGAAGTDNVISCGSYTATGNDTINLGYEPQWVLLKRASGAGGDWELLDNMRGMPISTGSQVLYANSSAAEGVGGTNFPTATGFTSTSYGSGTIIYIAIRRGPMKTPTSGTSVYNAIARTGTGAATTITEVGFTPDLLIDCNRTATATEPFKYWWSRLTASRFLASNNTNPDAGGADDMAGFDVMNGVRFGGSASQRTNASGFSYINWFFRRAPGFFDVVCYTGTGANRTVTHNLGVAPELMIVKRRDDSASWQVYSAALSNTEYLVLNSTAAKATGTTRWNSTTPTSSVFSLGTDATVNGNGNTFVAYLFATVSGVSKVGSYTGNGSNQTINCGFTAGARFILIKRTDSDGDWYVFDSARGIVSGNDPQLKINTADAEETGYDAIDPDNSGFIVNNNATNFPINVNNATYIYLAIA